MNSHVDAWAAVSLENPYARAPDAHVDAWVAVSLDRDSPHTADLDACAAAIYRAELALLERKLLDGRRSLFDIALILGRSRSALAALLDSAQSGASTPTAADESYASPPMSTESLQVVALANLSMWALCQAGFDTDSAAALVIAVQASAVFSPDAATTALESSLSRQVAAHESLAHASAAALAAIERGSAPEGLIAALAAEPDCVPLGADSVLVSADRALDGDETDWPSAPATETTISSTAISWDVVSDDVAVEDALVAAGAASLDHADTDSQRISARTSASSNVASSGGVSSRGQSSRGASSRDVSLLASPALLGEAAHISPAAPMVPIVRLDAADAFLASLGPLSRASLLGRSLRH